MTVDTASLARVPAQYNQVVVAIANINQVSCVPEILCVCVCTQGLKMVD